MKLYNTLSRNIDTITPQKLPRVTVYTCGPTVYDYPHVGNWFTYIREDILIRTLKLNGLEPNWVMNITDVGHLVSDADEGEDKLEKGARREGKTAWDVAKFYTGYFEEGLKRLGILRPDHLPSATTHITEQIALIRTLEEKGYTYTISDGVYYDTSKFSDYADFARLDIDEQEAGKRVDFNPEKRNTSDFALWKFSPADHQRDMEWDSQWGTGFPGWHIECSAMSMKYLGETLDIHAGGIDHVPVHHTNEIAQSQAATGKQFARIWMHSNHVTVEGEKISKSLGNGITLEDIEAKGISLAAFRLHVLESHYRSQSKFSWASLQAAQNRLNNWQEAFAMCWQNENETAHSETVTIGQFTKQLTAYLSTDLDTVHAVQLIDETAAAASNGYINGTELSAITEATKAGLGIDLEVKNITPEQNQLIKKRDQARAHKDWSASDTFRDQLIEQGIGLRDTPNGAFWYWLS